MFILLLMIFLHICDDYYLQGILANLKQKKWWIEHAPEPLYAHDHIVALLMHAFSWTFMIMLPIAFIIGFQVTLPFFIVFCTNVAIHAITDHAKANLGLISLREDQTIHIFQILCTFACLM